MRSKSQLLYGYNLLDTFDFPSHSLLFASFIVDGIVERPGSLSLGAET